MMSWKISENIYQLDFNILHPVVLNKTVSMYIKIKDMQKVSEYKIKIVLFLHSSKRSTLWCLKFIDNLKRYRIIWGGNLCTYLWESVYIIYFEMRRFNLMVNCNIPWSRVLCQIKKETVSWEQSSVSICFLTMDRMWPPAFWSEDHSSLLCWTVHSKCEPTYILPSSYFFSSSSFLVMPQKWEKSINKNIVDLWNWFIGGIWRNLSFGIEDWLNG